MKRYWLATVSAIVIFVLASCDSQTSEELKTTAQKAAYGIGLNIGKTLLNKVWMTWILKR